MRDMIEHLIDILYNMIRSAVYLDWGGFNYWIGEARDWFYDFVDEITKAIDKAVKALRDYVQGWIDWLADWSDWAENQIKSLWARATAVLNEAKNYAYGIVNDVYAWAAAKITEAKNYAYSIVNDVYNWAAAKITEAKNYAWGIVNEVWSYVYAYIKPWLDWLSPVKGYVDWFVAAGYWHLKQFISDPLGYILGTWAQILRDWLTFLQSVRALFIAFANEVMADLYNFWHLYAVALRAFMVDPSTWILGKVRYTFTDWLFGLLLELW